MGRLYRVDIAGSPAKPSAAQIQALQDAWIPCLESATVGPVSNGSVSVNFDLPRFGISLLTITPGAGVSDAGVESVDAPRADAPGATGAWVEAAGGRGGGSGGKAAAGAGGGGVEIGDAGGPEGWSAVVQAALARSVVVCSGRPVAAARAAAACPANPAVAARTAVACPAAVCPDNQAVAQAAQRVAVARVVVA